MLLAGSFCISRSQFDDFSIPERLTFLSGLDSGLPHQDLTGPSIEWR